MILCPKEMTVFRRMSPKARYVAFGVVWCLGIALLFILSMTGGDFVVMPAGLESNDITASANTIKSFSLARYNPERNGKLSFLFSFDSLDTENGNLGIFKTAMQRTVNLKGLKVEIFGNNSVDPDAAFGTEDYATLGDMIESSKGDFGRLLYGGLGSENGYGFKLAVDFNNITKLFVDGFQFNRFEDDVLGLEIKSKMAETSYGQPGLMLKGHVTIKTSNGNALECNRVIWDIEKQIFYAKSGYAFKQNEITKVGKEISLDMTLNEVAVSQNNPNNRKEIQRCYAKSQ